MRRTTTSVTVPKAAVALLVGLAGSPSSLWGQGRLEIDSGAGRIIAGGFEYAFRMFGGNAIDHSRGVPVRGRERRSVPHSGAVSLRRQSTEHVRCRRRRNGPGELRAIVAVVATDDGVLVAGYDRVLRWDSWGKLLETWRVPAAGVRGARVALRADARERPPREETSPDARRTSGTASGSRHSSCGNSV